MKCKVVERSEALKCNVAVMSEALLQDKVGCNERKQGNEKHAKL